MLERLRAWWTFDPAAEQQSADNPLTPLRPEQRRNTGPMLLLAFGWGPTRTLLRGDGIQAGYRASAKLMLRAWPRAVLVIAAALLLQLLLLSPFPTLLPEPALSMAALRSPWFWAEAFLSGALGVWFASVALALFQALEADAAAVPVPDQPPDSPPDQPSGK